MDIKEEENNSHIERIVADVKWYNPEKGYGFLTQQGNPADIMVHFSALDRIGCPYIEKGDQVICDVVLKKSGLQVVHIIEVNYGSPGKRTLSDFLKSRLSSSALENLEEIEGTLKWYNPKKGYGFVCPNDGGREVFLPSSIMRGSGYTALPPGTQVLIKVSYSERGPEAKMITLLHELEEEKQAG